MPNELDENRVDALLEELERLVDGVYERNDGFEDEVEEAFRRLAEDRFDMKRPPDEKSNGEPEPPISPAGVG